MSWITFRRTLIWCSFDCRVSSMNCILPCRSNKSPCVRWIWLISLILLLVSAFISMLQEAVWLGTLSAAGSVPEMPALSSFGVHDVDFGTSLPACSLLPTHSGGQSEHSGQTLSLHCPSPPGSAAIDGCADTDSSLCRPEQFGCEPFPLGVLSVKESPALEWGNPGSDGWSKTINFPELCASAEISGQWHEADPSHCVSGSLGSGDFDEGFLLTMLQVLGSEDSLTAPFTWVKLGSVLSTCVAALVTSKARPLPVAVAPASLTDSINMEPLADLLLFLNLPLNLGRCFLRLGEVWMAMLLRTPCLLGMTSEQLARPCGLGRCALPFGAGFPSVFSLMLDACSSLKCTCWTLPLPSCTWLVGSPEVWPCLSSRERTFESWSGALWHLEACKQLLSLRPITVLDDEGQNCGCELQVKITPWPKQLKSVCLRLNHNERSMV